MKHLLYIITLAATMAACSNSDDALTVGDGSPVAITFNVSGDFTLSTNPMTRTNVQSDGVLAAAPSGFTRALTSDGKDMTDVWCLDYVGGELQQQIHQTSADADFGVPTIDLTMGTHHIYFIASRGTSPVLNTEAHTLSFAKVLDTFWKDYEITVTTGTSNGSRSVALDRITTRLKVTFTDAIPTGAATFNITPASWHYGFDYLTGEPISATANQTIVVNIPNTSIGVAGEFVSVFGFSGTTEWTTDIAINCKKSDNTVLGSATITAAPFLRNRSSDYTGPLFSDNGAMTLSLNTDWSTSHTGSW